MNISAFLFVPLKSNLGSAAAFLPSAFFRNATCAFSSLATVFRKALPCGLSRVPRLPENRRQGRERTRGVLVLGDGFQEGVALRAERQAGQGCAVVEGGLEVLERQRVVQDADIAFAERRRGSPVGRQRERARGQSREHGAAAHRGCPPIPAFFRKLRRVSPETASAASRTAPSRSISSRFSMGVIRFLQDRKSVV